MRSQLAATLNMRPINVRWFEGRLHIALQHIVMMWQFLKFFRLNDSSLTLDKLLKTRHTHTFMAYIFFKNCLFMFLWTTPTYPLVLDRPHQASFQTNYPWAKMAYKTFQHDSAQMMTSWSYPAPCVALVIGNTKIQPTVQKNHGKANFVQTLLRQSSTNLLKYA